MCKIGASRDLLNKPKLNMNLYSTFHLTGKIQLRKMYDKIRRFIKLIIT